MALLEPYSYDLGSMFDIPSSFISDLPPFHPDEDEEDLLQHLFHHDFNNLLPQPQPLLFDHHCTTTTPPPPDSYYDMIPLHDHPPPDDHYIHTTTIPTPADSYDFHFDSDLYPHHQLLPPGTELGFEDSTFFPPLPLYLPQQDTAPQLLQDDYLFDEPPPKRHKSSHYPSNCNIPPPPFDHFSPNYPSTLTASEVDTFNVGYYNKEKDFSSCGRQRRPTAQSIAARDRRKRISDKTQELARLLPGAAKMNTAEMLQNAFSYVKFLQAQVDLLQLMDSPHSSFQNKAAAQNLQVLSSSAVQEKLYTKHKCLVPLEFVSHLAKDLPHLSTELTQFIAVHSTL